MREIIFRGKTVCDGDWVYGGITWNPSRKKFFIHTDWEEAKVIPETVGQYTGLTDENGVKIFEGDILHAAQGNFVVRWSESICSFVAGEKERMRPCMNSGTMNCCEVIGNIFDNPELIELDIHKAEAAESE